MTQPASRAKTPDESMNDPANLPPVRSDTTIPGLQYFRAVAASLVVFYHAANAFGPKAYFPVRSWETIFLFGHSGVELFFVLSGFIICHIHWDRIGRQGEVGNYIRKRLVRIYPPVMIVVLAWAALRWAGHTPLTPIEWLDSLTLFPFDFQYAPPVLWTLSFEMAFYAVFLLAFINRRLFITALALWGISGYVICEFTVIGHQEAVNPLLGSAYTFLFGFGVFAFFAVRRLPPLSVVVRFTLAIGAVALFALAALLDVKLQLSGTSGLALEIASRHLSPLFGIAGVMALIVLADPRVRLSGAAHRTMFFLGNASYAIYLWHLFPQRLLVRGMARFGLDGVELRWLAVALFVVSGIALGSIVYILIEKPMLKRINVFFAGRRSHRTDDRPHLRH